MNMYKEIYGDECFNDFNDFVMMYDCIAKQMNIDEEASASVKSFISWFKCESDELIIPNDALKDYLIGFREHCGNNFGYMVKRMKDAMITDEFRNLFPQNSRNSVKPRVMLGSYVKGVESDGFVFSRSLSTKKYKPIKDYDICDSHKELFDYFHYVMSQIDDVNAPRIIALLGESGSGKNYITNELFPYYLSKKIKGNLYVTVIDGSNNDSQSEIFFKVSAFDPNKIIVGRLADAIMCSNECDNDDDVFLVIYNEYTRTPLSEIDKALSLLGGLNQAFDIGGRTFRRKPNLYIIMNGNLKQIGVDEDIALSEAMASRIVPVYESPFSVMDARTGEYKKCKAYYGTWLYKDRINNYVKPYGSNSGVAIDCMFDCIDASGQLMTLDCREVSAKVMDSVIKSFDFSLDDYDALKKELRSSH